MNIKCHLPVLLVLISKAQQGFQAEYYNGQNFDQKVLTRIDPKIHFVWNNVPPAPGMDPHIYSVRWSGKLKAPESGQYFFRAKVDDGIGNAEKNLILSKERAQTVADYLISKGVSGHRITTIGYGDTRPLVKEAKDVPNEKNRRVEFYLEEY